MKAEIVKVDQDKRLVFGWASVAKTADGKVLVDRQGDTIEDEWQLEKAAYQYVLDSRTAGEEHVLTDGVGTLVESIVVTPEKLAKMGLPPGSLPTGWWLGFKIQDDRVWDGIRKGRYTGFSVHGKGRRYDTDLDLDKHVLAKTGLTAIIKYVRYEGGKWCVYSEAGKKLGSYSTKAEANERLRQIEAAKAAKGKR